MISVSSTSIEASVASRRTHAWAAPRATIRGGLRVARVSGFMHETLGRLRERWPLPGGEVPRDLARRVHDMQWLAEGLCALHSVSVVVHGSVPREPCLLVANHLGSLDALAIGSVLRCVTITEHEASSGPLLGEALVRLGNLLVRPGDPHSGAAALLRARACLAQGVPVLALPERTPAAGDAVLPLRHGVLALARLTGLPVVPVAVRHRPRAAAWIGDPTVLPHYLRTSARAATRVDLAFGAPLSPRAAPSARALAALTHERLATLLRDLEDHA
jgi:1-acyl-sn-glycerol-3-phosphate acyltransferase